MAVEVNARSMGFFARKQIGMWVTTFLPYPPVASLAAGGFYGLLKSRMDPVIALGIALPAGALTVLLVFALGLLYHFRHLTVCYIKLGKDAIVLNAPQEGLPVGKVRFPLKEIHKVVVYTPVSRSGRGANTSVGDAGWAWKLETRKAKTGWEFHVRKRGIFAFAQMGTIFASRDLGIVVDHLCAKGVQVGHPRPRR